MAALPTEPSSQPVQPSTRTVDTRGEKPKVWDSPWYWLHLFCVASLLGVLLVAPKFAERQAGVERKFQGRQRAALQKAGKTTEQEMASPENRHVQLWPIYALLGVGAAGSWVALWQTHFRQPHPGTLAAAPGGADNQGESE